MIKKLFRNSCFTLLFLFLSISLTAQEAKYEFNGDKGEISVFVELNKEQLQKEDSLDKQIAAPIRLAVLYPLKVDLLKQGKWLTIDGGRKACKLIINAPQSHGVIIRYSDFYLPEGAKLYVYNEDNKYDSWVYTHEQNTKGGQYSTEVLSGDKITLEYIPSTASSESPRLQISQIGYKYRQINEVFYSANGKQKIFNDPRNKCMININCPEGALWQEQKKGVMLIRMQRGSSLYLCSGSLVNNTNEDKTPYVLTAYHCFFTNSGEPIVNAEMAEFYFNYETDGCENEPTEPPFDLMTGAEILVANPIVGGSDGILLKLKEDIPSDWDVYYNGWDRENDGSKIKSGVVIHHPQGDVKKITTYSTPLTSSEWSETSSNVTNTHWRVTYSSGVTEGGSSGSPIFNASGLIVGSLTGGNSTCELPYLPDWFGKFWYHWDQSPNTNMHMSKYLDPQNINPTSLDGLPANENGVVYDVLLDISTLAFAVGDLSEVTILRGNRGYSVSSSNPGVASVTIIGRRITVTAVSLGEAIITVRDKLGKTATVAVSVHRDIELTLDKGSSELVVNIYRENDLIKEIRMIDLFGRIIYTRKNLEEAEHRININQMNKGIYILRIDSKVGISKTKKIQW